MTVGSPHGNRKNAGWSTVQPRVALKAKIRVLLADDHETILARLRALLGKDFEIVGAVNNGRDAVAEVLRLDPDVLVIDISMPVLDGLQAVTRLSSAHRRTKFVFLTVHEDEDFVAAAFSAGASGYVIKSHVTTDLVPAIREALQGRTFVSQMLDS
jgi:DNA-binding NarL/FixJ family response regulator